MVLGVINEFPSFTNALTFVRRKTYEVLCEQSPDREIKDGVFQHAVSASSWYYNNYSK
jgi:hypothetical protein